MTIKEAQELFSQKEQQYLDMGDGLEDVLQWIQDQGMELQVVSEMKKTLGPVGSDIVSRFLKGRGLTRLLPDHDHAPGKDGHRV